MRSLLLRRRPRIAEGSQCLRKFWVLCGRLPRDNPVRGLGVSRSFVVSGRARCRMFLGVPLLKSNELCGKIFRCLLIYQLRSSALCLGLGTRSMKISTCFVTGI